MDSSKSYYEQRERQERELAAKAGDPTAQRVHLEMADRYRALITSGSRSDVQFIRTEQQP